MFKNDIQPFQHNILMEIWWLKSTASLIKRQAASMQEHSEGTNQILQAYHYAKKIVSTLTDDILLFNENNT